MEIYQALSNDHNELKPWLDRLVQASEDDRDTGIILDQIKALLIPHARAEEAVFYNTLREIEGSGSTVRHAYREHMEAESMLRTLLGFEKVNFEWTMLARKLRKALLHHIHEEEMEIFPKARAVFSQEEAEQMAVVFENAKQQAEEQGDIANLIGMAQNLMPKRLRNLMGTSELS